MKRPSILLGGAHLAALWSLAILQPMLNLLGSTPEFFVARDNTPLEISVFVILLAFLPAAIATLIEFVISRFSQDARWYFHLMLVGILLATLSLVFLKALVDCPAGLMIALAVVAGILLAVAYARMKFMRSLTDILVVAPVIILFTFFVLSDSSRLTLSAPDVDAVEASVADPAPVVMVVFDEFPVGSLMNTDDSINAKRYPHFAELAATSDWYRDITTGGSYTTVAIPSILSGQPVERDSLPTVGDHPDNLFTLLGKTYSVHAVEPITQLCPDSICTDSVEAKPSFTSAMGSLVTDLKVVEEHLLLPKSMTENLPDISQTFSGFGGGTDSTGESIDRGRANQWIESRHTVERTFDGGQETDEMLAGLSPGGEDDGKPTLNFGHVEEPHYPWTDYPDGMAYGATTEDFRAFIPDEINWNAGRYVTDRATQAHLLEVGYVDYLVGRIINRLKQNGQWNKSLVVFTADHGGALIPHQPRRDANQRTIGEVATTPLFIKAPGQKSGEVITKPTCADAILPKMASILGVRIPWKVADCKPEEVSVDNGSGPVVKAPLTQVLAGRQRYIDRVADLFGDDTGWNSVLKLGPNKDLIGDQLDTLSVDNGDSGISANPDQTGEGLTGYKPGRRYNLVLRQRGTLDGAKAGMPMAIGVNGRVAATGQTYDAQGTIGYTILLPQWSLRPGNNDISIYEVDGKGSNRTLKRLQLPSDG